MKTIIFMFGGILILALVILLLPVLILLYIFLPKRPARTWFNTFTQQARARGARQSKVKKDTESNYYDEIPASEDVIDVRADEIKDEK